MFRFFRKIKNRALRYGLIIFCILILFIAVVIAFISPITKYLVEKYSEKYVGRKIAMSWLYVNPFTGYINAHNLIVYEKQSPQAFIKAANLSVNITVSKLFAKAYDISSVTFDRLWVNVIQDSTIFNFSDLVEVDTTIQKEVVHYCIRNIQINNSEFHYHERIIPVKYYITKVNLRCSNLEWDVDTTHLDYDFVSGMGSGTVKGSVNMNMKESLFDLKAVVTRFDLKVLEQYMKDFSNYGTFSAFLDADVHSKGSMKNSLDMMTTGKVAITDFHFGKTEHDDYVSFSRFSMNIDSLNPAGKKYFFNTVLLDSPYIKYEKYDQLDNFSTMFGIKGANVKEAQARHGQINIIFTIATYLSELAANIVNSDYRVDQASITNAHLLYNDYSLMEKFSITANPVAIKVRDIDTKNKRMHVTLNTRLHPFGDVDVKYDVNPKDFNDFHLEYKVDDLPLPLFNPYTITYSSFPFHKGTVELNGTWNVINGQINSNNHLLITNPTTADKVKNKGAKKIPVPLVMFFVRNFNRKIDVDIPITGDLKNPKYHLWDAILDVITNIVIKPPTFPYRVSKEKAKEEKEEFEVMEWRPMQGKLNDDQEDQLKKISRYLFFHPNSNLTIKPKYFEDKEKEMIVLFEAKKKYFAAERHFKISELSEEDSIEISKFSVKDSLFVRYLDRVANKGGLVFANELKCWILVGQSKVNKEYEELVAMRKKQIMDYFADKKTGDRITFEKAVSTIPPSGFSHCIFRYTGEEPEELKDKK